MLMELPQLVWAAIGALACAVIICLGIIIVLRQRNQSLQKELHHLSDQLAQCRGKNILLEEQEARHLENRRQFQQMQSKLAEQMATEARLRAILEKERQAAQEKVAFLQQAHRELKIEFQNLATRIFEEKSARFTRDSRNLLEGMLAPVRSQLEEFKKKIEHVYDKESRDRAILASQIQRLEKLNQRIGQDAINLTRALKGDSRVQGNWGEVILERVLENSGLAQGREYATQVCLRDKSGRLYRPDVVIHLPRDKNIIVDSKVSLRAFARYHDCQDDDCRQAALEQHLQALRQHVRSLAAKRYWELEEMSSPDFVLMFLPVEAAFLTAVEHDPDLITEALQNNVMLVSPSTLLITLRTIENIWRHEYQSRHAVEIARQAAGLYDKFVGFVEALQEVGEKLNRAKDAYLTAYQRLIGGRGNLVKRIDNLKQLGVKPGRQLPADLVEDAGQQDEIQAGCPAKNKDDPCATDR